MKSAVILRQDAMGHGDQELGQKILGAFLRKCQHGIPGLKTIVLYNSAVSLLAESSNFLAEFSQLEEQGITVLACGTCVSHFDLKLKAGEISSMDEILRELDAADKVITL